MSGWSIITAVLAIRCTFPQGCTAKEGTDSTAQSQEEKRDTDADADEDPSVRNEDARKEWDAAKKHEGEERDNAGLEWPSLQTWAHGSLSMINNAFLYIYIQSFLSIHSLPWRNLECQALP